MHVYVHIPFCARRCSYCDFAIAVRRRTPAREYLDAVLREWRSWLDHPAVAGSPETATIYLGGGTPSRLAPDVLAELVARIRSDRPAAGSAEVTLEANPDDVTPIAARGWLAGGINRVSLGAQSFSPAALGWMHRTHTADQIGRAVNSLRDAGAGNISLDLIYGLPDEVPRNWEADLDAALGLEPEHISLYGLTVEPRTPLARWTARGSAALPSEARAEEEYLRAHRRLAGAGYVHYEVSNAARPGFFSRHNQAYWERKPYLGLGPSAHSQLGTTRSWNLPAWEEYRRTVLAGGSPVQGSESLTPDQVGLEELYLSLRTLKGVPELRLDPTLTAQWVAAGWAVRESGRVRLTVLGWLRLDPLVAGVTHC